MIFEGATLIEFSSVVPHWYRAEGDEPFEFICVVPNAPDHIEILEKRES